MSQVVTFYSDKEKTDALYPRTKLSAISDNNNKALSEIINDEANARQTADNALNARMNTFTSLPEGSTTGDAELIDIRIGANGTTYPNAGSAVRGQISELKSDLAKQKELFENTIGTNKFDQTTLVFGKNLSTTDGSEVSASNDYMVSPFIDVSNVSKINFYTCDSNKVPVGGAYRWFWYNNDKTFLSYETNGSMEPENAKTIPSNAQYVRFVCITFSSKPYYMMVFDTDEKPNYEAYTNTPPQKVVDRFAELENRIVDNSETVITSINHLDETKIINGRYSANGTFRNDDGFYTLSEKIDITNAEIINSYICDNTYGRAVSSWYTMIFFDENNQFISGKTNNSYGDISASLIDDVPQNAKYCIPSFVGTSKGSKYMLSFEETQYGYDEYKTKTFSHDLDVERLRPDKWVGKKVLVIGDSISTSNYRGLADDGQNNALWKKWDDILADRLGFTMTKDAISASGFIVQPTTTQVGVQSICNRVDNYPSDGDYDMIIIFAGINDFLQGIEVGTISEDKTANFISAVDYSVKTLIERFPRARLVALLPLPIGMFANPSQNDTSAYVNALIDRYNYYNVPYLDLAHNSGFKPHIATFKNMFTLGGGSATNVVPDGLHPNKEWDNNYLAPMIEEFINRFI